MTDPSSQGPPLNTAPSGAGAGAAAQQHGAAGPNAQETISFISTARGQAVLEHLTLKVRESIPFVGLVLCTAEDFEQEALSVRIPADPRGLDFATASRALYDIAERCIAFNEGASATVTPRRATVNAPSPPDGRRDGARARPDFSFGGRAGSPTPSVISIATSASTPIGKRPRTEASTPSAAGASGDDSIARQGEAFASDARGRATAPTAFASTTSIEAEYFTPMLVDANLARRKVCTAIERMGAQLVEIPADKILSATSSEFAQAPLRLGADDDSLPQERAALMSELIETYGHLRKAGALLKQSISHVMRIYWLANHTAGASWDTVAQLCYREDWDRRMAAVTDGYTPLQTWDDKVATAMRSIHQDKHLSKEGVPLGPINPRLAQKSAFAGNRDRGIGAAKPQRGKGRGGYTRGRPNRDRRSHGKENKPAGARAAAAGPAGAGAAAAAAAAGGG